MSRYLVTVKETYEHTYLIEADSEEEAERIYTEKRYICTSTAIWQPQYSQAQGRIYFIKISDYKGLANRGRFYTLTAEQINHIMGYEYLRTE